jgi:hypothetical protein
MSQPELNLGNTKTLLLTGERQVVIQVDYNDLDEAITTFLKSKGFADKMFIKHGYECIAENEWSNYQSHNFDVYSEMPDDEELNDIKGLGTGELLCWMCAEGRVEAGNYSVNIFW